MQMKALKSLTVSQLTSFLSFVEMLILFCVPVGLKHSRYWYREGKQSSPHIWSASLKLIRVPHAFYSVSLSLSLSFCLYASLIAPDLGYNLNIISRYIIN